MNFFFFIYNVTKRSKTQAELSLQEDFFSFSLFFFLFLLLCCQFSLGGGGRGTCGLAITSPPEEHEGRRKKEVKRQINFHFFLLLVACFFFHSCFLLLSSSNLVIPEVKLQEYQLGPEAEEVTRYQFLEKEKRFQVKKIIFEELFSSESEDLPFVVLSFSALYCVMVSHDDVIPWHSGSWPSDIWWRWKS